MHLRLQKLVVWCSKCCCMYMVASFYGLVYSRAILLQLFVGMAFNCSCFCSDMVLFPSVIRYHIMVCLCYLLLNIPIHVLLHFLSCLVHIGFISASVHLLRLRHKVGTGRWTYMGVPFYICWARIFECFASCGFTYFSPSRSVWAELLSDRLPS